MNTVCLARSQRLHPLVARFREAGLPLEVRKRPLAGRDVVIFQFDIPRKIRGDPRSEYFRIYLGKPESRVEVVATDSNLRQIVMLVEEQQPAVRRVARHLVPRGAKVRGDVPSGLVEVETFVPGRKRHFLLGVDDRQLFVCLLPRAVSTVREAHACLKPEAIFVYEGEKRDVDRQGEWFFVEPSDEEIALLAAALKTKRASVRHGAAIGPHYSGAAGGWSGPRQREGNPHVADQLVVLAADPDESRLGGGDRLVFVRGRIRHRDHSTIQFIDWHKVIRNAERPGRVTGIDWTD